MGIHCAGAGVNLSQVVQQPGGGHHAIAARAFLAAVCPLIHAPATVPANPT
jgi:hypothetical protein